MMKKLHFQVIFSGLIGLAAMGLDGWKLAGDGHDSPLEPSKTERSRERKLNVVPRAFAGQLRESDRQMAAIRKMRDPAAQMRAAIAMARDLPADEFERWVVGGFFSQREGFAFTLFKQIAEQRWKDEALASYLTCYLRRDSYNKQNELEEMIKKNPELAISLLDSPDIDETDWSNPGKKTILSTLSESYPKLVFNLIQKGGVAESGGQLKAVFRNLAKYHAADLRAELADFDSDAKNEAEKALVYQNLKTDFSKGLDELVAHPDGVSLLAEDYLYKSEDNFELLLDKMPTAWCGSVTKLSRSILNNTKNFAKWLDYDWESRGFSGKEVKDIRYNLLRDLSENKPKEMLARIGVLEMAGWQRDELMTRALRRAGSDAASTLQFLSNDSDRVLAKGILEKLSDGNNIFPITNSIANEEEQKEGNALVEKFG